MPTKPISPRARLLAYFATAAVPDGLALLEDARAILLERKRASQAGMIKISAKPAPAAATAKTPKTPKTPAANVADSL